MRRGPDEAHRGAPLLEPSGSTQVPYPPEQIDRGNRLLDELKSVTPGSGIANEDFAAGVPGKEEYATPGDYRADFDGRVNAIDFQHSHIAKEEIRRPVPGLLDSESAAIHRNGFVFVLIKDHGEGISDDPLVIRHQNPSSFRQEHGGSAQGPGAD